ncbi:MAG TPA: DUF3152 domain-containing protein, partial [Jatrophihabitantaceae bacterium]
MSERDGDWSRTTQITISRPEDAARDRAADVAAARRRVASFGGGGGPGFGESVRDFVRRYGWRAYALPVLLIVTVVALLTMQDSPGSKSAPRQQAADTATQTPAPSSPPVAPSSIPLKSDQPSAGSYQNPLQTGALPSGAPYAKAGSGTFRVIKGTSKVVGHGPLYRYDVEVENGITGIDTQQFASMVQKTLADPRSWSGHGVSLQRVDSGPINFHVSLTSSMTVRQYCGYDIHVETSCYAQAGSASGVTVNRVVLNDSRWVRGAAPYVGDLNAYRIYMINHEDGHAMGHQHAHECLPGGLAPVMMQQTFGLKSAETGAMCQANP